MIIINHFLKSLVIPSRLHSPNHHCCSPMELISVMERSATLEDVEQLAKQFADDGFVIVDTQLPVSDLNALHKAINQKIDSNEIRKSTRSHHSWKTRYSINDDRWLRTPEFARFVTTILPEFAALSQGILGNHSTWIELAETVSKGRHLIGNNFTVIGDPKPLYQDTNNSHV